MPHLGHTDRFCSSVEMGSRHFGQSGLAITTATPSGIQSIGRMAGTAQLTQSLFFLLAAFPMRTGMPIHTAKIMISTLTVLLLQKTMPLVLTRIRRATVTCCSGVLVSHSTDRYDGAKDALSTSLCRDSVVAHSRFNNALFHSSSTQKEPYFDSVLLHLLVPHVCGSSFSRWLSLIPSDATPARASSGPAQLE